MIKKIIIYIFCIIIIVCGALSTVELAEMFGVISQEVGTPTYIEEQNKNVCKLDLSECMFNQETINHYSMKKDFEPIAFDSTKHNYIIKLNGREVIDCEIKPGEITINEKISFYQSTGELIVKTSYKITIIFESTKTSVSVVCHNTTPQAVSHLQQYIYNNGLVITIHEEENSNEESN